MKEILRPYTNWRTYVLAILGMAAVILVCTESSTETSLLADLAAKIAGLAIAYAAYRLGKFWYNRGQLNEFAELEEE